MNEVQPACGLINSLSTGISEIGSIKKLLTLDDFFLSRGVKSMNPERTSDESRMRFRKMAVTPERVGVRE